MNKKLIELLTNAVKRVCGSESKIGIILSAGVDSTLIAIIANKFTEITAYSCGIEGSLDLECAENLKKYVDFDIKTLELSAEDIEKSLSDIVHAINDTNPVKVSVEVPFYFLSKEAHGDSINVMLCGQGADELFAGYKRYIDILAEEGYKGVEKAIRRDVENIWVEQLNKDSAVCAINKIDLRFPYMDEKFLNYTMNIPIELKIYNTDEFECVDFINNKKFVRKYILRKIAKEVGVPDFILNRKKKAAQYGSGAWKIIDRIAREKGFKIKAREVGRKDYVRMFLEMLNK